MEQKLHLIQKAYSHAVMDGDERKKEKCLKLLEKDDMLSRVNYSLEKYGSGHQVRVS